MLNKHKIIWFHNPCDFGNINWKELNFPTEQTINFENNGDKKSKYIYAQRNKDKKYMKVGKVIKNFIMMPFVLFSFQFFGMVSMLYYFLDNVGSLIIVGCTYIMLLLVYFHYLIDIGNKIEEKKKIEMVSYWM